MELLQKTSELEAGYRCIICSWTKFSQPHLWIQVGAFDRLHQVQHTWDRWSQCYLSPYDPKLFQQFPQKYQLHAIATKLDLSLIDHHRIVSRFWIHFCSVWVIQIRWLFEQQAHGLEQDRGPVVCLFQTFFGFSMIQLKEDQMQGSYQILWYH